MYQDEGFLHLSIEMESPQVYYWCLHHPDVEV
jgi:hypothetical protein